MKKVLIVEDDAVITHVYRSSLEKAGYAVETVNDGKKGLERAAEYRPDAILLDLMLPTMNGIDVLKHLRTRAEFDSVPIVVFTNADLPDLVQRAVSSGASQVFSKASVTPRHVVDAIDYLLHGEKVIAKPEPDIIYRPPPPATDHPGSPPPPANHGYAPPPSQPSVNRTPSANDPGFGAGVRKAFIDANAETLAVFRKLVQGVVKAGEATSRERFLLELCAKVHSLSQSAGVCGLGDIAQLTSVLEALLKDLIAQPTSVNESTLRTVVSSVDFLGEMFKAGRPCSGDISRIRILIVDDEYLSRRAISYALKKAHINFQATDVDDPAVGLRMATEKPFDLIFLDVRMPNIEGFDLCSRIRALPLHKSTPIIFVTSLSDFKSRAKSTLSGASDLIAKPFLFIELALKTMTILLRHRLAPREKAA